MDALRRSVKVSVGVARRPGEFTPLPTLPWDANMAPHRGDEGEARVCVCS